MKIGYLGPEGSYTHSAAKNAFGKLLSAEAELLFVDCKTISDVVEKLGESELDYGIVPIENSLEGSVGETIDSLMRSEGIYISKEYVLPIRHNLLCGENISAGEITKIYAHPMSFGQCRKFLREQCTNAKLENASSNSAAALFVSELPEDPSDKLAAIASEASAGLYNLNIVESEINDEKNNETRFWLIGKEAAEPTGNDKTTLIFQAKDEPGSLVKILQEFSDAGINLTRIESRPSKKVLGDYIFHIDFNLHKEDSKFIEVNKKIQLKLSYCKWLGSYSRVQ